MTPFLYMPVADHYKLRRSFLEFAEKNKKKKRSHAAALSSCEKRNKLRKAANFLSTQADSKSP